MDLTQTDSRIQELVAALTEVGHPHPVFEQHYGLLVARWWFHPVQIFLIGKQSGVWSIRHELGPEFVFRHENLKDEDAHKELVRLLTHHSEGSVK